MIDGCFTFDVLRGWKAIHVRISIMLKWLYDSVGPKLVLYLKVQQFSNYILQKLARSLWSNFSNSSTKVHKSIS